MTAGEVQDSSTAAELRLGSLYLQHLDSHKADVSDVLPKQEMQSSDCEAVACDPAALHPARRVLGHCTTPEAISANIPQTEATECEVGLPDTYLSPTADSCESISLATTDKGGSFRYNQLVQLWPDCCMQKEAELSATRFFVVQVDNKA